MLLMVKVEALVPPENIRQLWREHVMLHEPVSHVVILSTPAPEIHAIPIDPLKLLSGKDADTSKEILSWHTVDVSIALPSKKVCYVSAIFKQQETRHISQAREHIIIT